MAASKFLHPYGSIIRLFGAWVVFFAWVFSGALSERYQELKKEAQDIRVEIVLRYAVERLESHGRYGGSAPPESIPGSANGVSNQLGMENAGTRTEPASRVCEEDIDLLAMLMSDLTQLSRELTGPEELNQRVRQTSTAIQTEASRLTRPSTAYEKRPRSPTTALHATCFGSSGQGSSIFPAENENEVLAEYDEISLLLNHELARRERVATVANGTAVLLYILGTILAVYGEWLRRPARTAFPAT